MRVGTFVGVVSVCITLSARPVSAQAVHDPAAADELFERGKELLKSGDWSAACAKFQASMDLDPAVGTLLKLAKCSEHDKKLTLALHQYQSALTLAREKPDQTEARRAELEAYTEKLLAELEPRVPRLRVVIEDRPPGLKVARGGEGLPFAALGEELPADPGPIEVVASAPGFAVFRREVLLEEGAHATVSVALVPLPRSVALVPVRPPPAPIPSPAPHAASKAPGAPSDVAAFTLGGVGIVGLGLATYFGVDTANKVSDASPYCKNNQCFQTGYDLIGQAHGTQTAAFALLGVGASCLAAGALLFFLKSKSSVALTASPRGADLSGVW
jgi:hypothetical protein